MRRPSRLSTLAWLAAALLSAAPGLAAEQLVESMDGSRKFAPLWPGGTFELGGQNGFAWARAVTDGQGGGTFAANVRPYAPPIDATGKFVKVTVKVDDVSQLGGMEFRLSSDRFNQSYYAFGLTLYDDADFNVLRDSVWTTLTFSFGSARVEGTPDRSRLNSVGWYVADKGEGAPITAYWGGLSLVDEPTQGVVSITFDDGYDEHLLAAKMMAKYGMQGTAYIIPSAIGAVGYLTHHQLVDLQERYGWDIAAHYNTPFTEMRPDELETAILGVQRFLEENQFGDGAGHLAYPLGKQNTSLVRPLVRKHFTTARVAAAGPETIPPADPHLLRVFNVLPSTTPEQVGHAVRRAAEHKEWLILMMHYLVEEPSNDLEYGIEQFDAMLREINEAGARVMPLARVWRGCMQSFAASAAAAGGCDLGAVPAKAK